MSKVLNKTVVLFEIRINSPVHVYRAITPLWFLNKCAIVERRRYTQLISGELAWAHIVEFL